MNHRRHHVAAVPPCAVQLGQSPTYLSGRRLLDHLRFDATTDLLTLNAIATPVTGALIDMKRLVRYGGGAW